MGKKLTKTEMKRLLAAILSKAKKLWLARQEPGYGMSTADMVAIEKIIHKYQKKL